MLINNIFITKTLQVLLLVTKFSQTGYLIIKVSDKEVNCPHFCILYLCDRLNEPEICSKKQVY